MNIFFQTGFDENQNHQRFYEAAESKELSKSDVSKQLKGREEPLGGQPIEFQQTTGVENVGTPYDKMLQSKEEKENLVKILMKDSSQSADGQDYIDGVADVSNDVSKAWNSFFKMRSEYNAIFKMLNNEQAGKLIKGTNAYVFDGVPFESKDVKVQGAFEMLKKGIDRELRGRVFGLTYGRKGLLQAIENRQKFHGGAGSGDIVE